MTMTSVSRRAIPRVLALLVLVGCQTSPNPNLYTLAPDPAAPSAAPFAGTVGVAQVALPKYLDRPEIVRYSNAYEITAGEFNRWGEPLGDMTTRVIVENLAERLPDSRVFTTSGPLTLDPVDAKVEIGIDKFDAGPGGTVVLVARWIVHREKRADRLRAAVIRIPTGSNDAGAQVAAMSEALGQLASRIAADLSG